MTARRGLLLLLCAAAVSAGLWSAFRSPVPQRSPAAGSPAAGSAGPSDAGVVRPIAEADRALDVATTPPDPARGVRVTLVAKDSLERRVEFVTVIVAPSVPELTTRSLQGETDKNGELSVLVDDERSYVLAYKDGLSPLLVQWSDLRRSTDRMETVVEVRLHDLVGITCQVRDLAGNPIEAATVSARPALPANYDPPEGSLLRRLYCRSRLSNHAGVAEFVLGDAQTYTFSASEPGFVSVQHRYGVGGEETGQIEFRLPAILAAGFVGATYRSGREVADAAVSRSGIQQSSVRFLLTSSVRRQELEGLLSALVPLRNVRWSYLKEVKASTPPVLVPIRYIPAPGLAPYVGELAFRKIRDCRKEDVLRIDVEVDDLDYATVIVEFRSEDGEADAPQCKWALIAGDPATTSTLR